MQKHLPRILKAIMFTDMVGFTQLMHRDEELGLQMRQRHRAVLEENHRTYQGNIIQYFGDGTLSLFSNALDAVLCAIEIQRAFIKPPELPLRIGIHLGHVIIQPDGIIGDAVNIASRMESFSIPGGVLVSDTVNDQIKNQPDIQTISLGKYRLKNVDRPYEIFAITDEGLTIPEPSHLEGKGEKTMIFPANFPNPASPLLGREAEVTEVLGYLDENRIVTITGTGGVGKTRLAIEAASHLVNEYAGRMVFVPMATVTSTSRFFPSLASALNVKESEGRDFQDGIKAVIADKKALLVLDNLEQIIASADDIADLISYCSNLKILATSRTPLRVSAEQEYPLAPLTLPAQKQLSSLEEMITSPAVALFIDRAKKANHRFQLTLENAPTVAEICRRLDGLPLALELAAARTRLLSPNSLLERLTRTLDFLSGGSRDLPDRQKTLRATIDWSHSLLSDEEKMLFRRLAVFSGGFTLTGVEDTCRKKDGEMLLDEFELLLEKGLVIRDSKQDRYSMLQTIKEYAQEKLEAEGELNEIRQNHALFYLDVAKRVHKGIQGKDQLEWMDRADQEEANIETALEWSLAKAKEGDEDAAELGLQLCGELWMYWHIRGMHIGAKGWVDAFLATTKADHATPGLCAALITGALCSWTLGNFPRAVEELETCYQIAKRLDLAFEMASATCCLGISYLPLGEIALATKNLHESIEICLKIDNKWLLGFSTAFDGLGSFVSGELSEAKSKYREAIRLQRKVGDNEGHGFSLGGLAQVAAAEGEYQQAVQFYQEALASYARIGDRAEEARILEEVAWTYLKIEDAGEARRHFSDSIQAYNEVGSVRGIGLALMGLAATEQLEGSAYRAVQIAAAAEHFLQQEGIVNIYSENNPAKEYIDNARSMFSPNEISTASEEGRMLSVEDVLDMAS